MLKIVLLKMSEVFIDLQSFAFAYVYLCFANLKSMKNPQEEQAYHKKIY